jgi:signal peptide peptidase SppA
MTEHRSLARVTAQILNRPLLVTPRHATLILSALRSELNLALIHQVDGNRPLDRSTMDMIAMDGRVAADDRRAARASARKVERKIFAEQNGIAIIPIEGTLMKNWGLEPYSGSTGYDGIKAKLMAAMEDDDIVAIYLVIDSPGGVVAGCMDLADLIFACSKRSGGKPIWAIADEQCCSAAFALGSQADRLFVPRTGEVGSVGVVWIYTNVEDALAEAGIKVRVFRAGAHKAEGNAYETMGTDTAKRIQDELDEMREIFVETVARGRGMSKKAVRDTEALTYMGGHARDVRFATEVMSDDQAWAQMVQRFGR